MPDYAEYLDGTCDHYSDYHDYSDVCSNTYTNYTNCAYGNHSDGASATYYSNYSNQSYKNYSQAYSCSEYSDHHDHTDWSPTDKGVAQTLTWNSPWGGTSQNRTLDTTYIMESVEAIKELRDNIFGLTSKLHYNANIANDMINLPDTEFDDSNPETNEYINPDTVNDPKANLDNLWAAIKGDDDASAPGVSAVSTGELINKLNWQELASKADELAEYADPSYLNHVDYANGVSGGYQGPPD